MVAIDRRIAPRSAERPGCSLSHSRSIAIPCSAASILSPIEMPSGGDDAEDAAAPLLVPDQRHGSLYFFNVCQRLRELSCAVNFLSALFFVSESFPLKVL